MIRPAALLAAVLALLPAPLSAQDPGDAPVRSALGWLARRQAEDGHWDATGSRDHGFGALYEPDAAAQSPVIATSCALLAFLGAGHTPWSGEWRETSKRAWEWLQREQKRVGGGALVADPGDAVDGTLAARQRAERRAHVARLNHLWGTLALLEVAASAEFAADATSRAEARRGIEAALPPAEAALAFITGDSAVRPAAFDFPGRPGAANMDELGLLAAIAGDAGVLHAHADLAWFAAVPAAMIAVQRGMTSPFVPRTATDDGDYWIGGTSSTSQSMIGFVWMLERGSADQMAAAGPALLAREPRWIVGVPVGAPSRHPDPGRGPAWEPCADEYGWFWEGMAFRAYAALDPDSWNRWLGTFEPVALEHQRRSGGEAGSWDPAGPHARVFGREVSTAWMAVTLQRSCRLRMARTHWDKLSRDSRWLSMFQNLGKGRPTRETCEICGMEVRSDTMFSKGIPGKTFYFCGQAHLDAFEAGAHGGGHDHR